MKTTISSFTDRVVPKLIYLFFFLGMMGLSSCSGGGGGSSSGTSAPPRPTGQGLSLPSILEASTFENDTSTGFDRIEFSVTSTDTSLTPTNFRLEGSDAAGFQLDTTITSTSNPNVFEVFIFFGNATPFDFETPTDEDANNVYIFDYVFDFGQTTYRIPVEVTVENVLEGHSVSGSSLSLNNSPIGISTIPDVSGDGLRDVVLLRSGNSESNVAVLSSQSIASSIGTNLFVGETALFSRFSINQQGTEKLTIKEAADGQGLDILFSDTVEDNFKYYDANTAADFEFLEGEVDPNAAANNPISYGPFVLNDFVEAEMTFDVNQDGHNDIFVSSSSIRGVEGPKGIIFGAAQSGPTDTTRSAALDISFSTDDFNGTAPAREFRVEPFPDIDGDGNPEIVLIIPQYLAIAGNDGNGAIWIVNSTRLASAPSTIGLDNVIETGVRRIIGDDDSLLGSSFIETIDENGDPFFLISYADSDSGLVGISLSNIQALPQQASLTDLLAGGVTYMIDAGPSLTTSIGSLFEVSDLDGDGARDFLSGTARIIKHADIIAGAQSGEAEHIISADRAQALGLVGSFSGIGSVLDVSDQGLIGYSQGSNGQRIILVDISELEQPIANPDGEITIVLPDN